MVNATSEKSATSDSFPHGGQQVPKQESRRAVLYHVLYSGRYICATVLIKSGGIGVSDKDCWYGEKERPLDVKQLLLKIVSRMLPCFVSTSATAALESLCPTY